jgi:hypothetical protein
MVAMRRIAIALLILSGIAAGTTAVLWSAALAGVAHTSVIGSDAMRPAFVTGDLVISTPVATEGLRAGDVISLPAEGASQLVTERVLEITRLPDGTWSILARGDAGTELVSEHIVGDRAWEPTLRVPVVGGVASAVLEPRLGLPLLSAFGLLVVAALLWGAPRPRATRTA